MTRSMATFWVEGLLLGVQIEHVQEVLLGQNVTPVPLADGAVAGLLNLRGRLAAVIDLRHRLGLPPRPPGEAPVHYVIRGDGEPVSLIVDREGEVVEVDDRSAEPVPETVSPTIRAFLTEAYQLDGPLLLVLDANGAITLPASLREVAHAGAGH